MQQLASTAWTATAAVLLIILVTYPLACRRLLADAVERPGGFGRVSRFAVLPQLVVLLIGRRVLSPLADGGHFLSTL